MFHTLYPQNCQKPLLTAFLLLPRIERIRRMERIGQMLHIVLCCLEGSTMSNLVHQRRRCARKVTNMILLPGGQYARGQVLLSNTDSTDRTDECPMAIKEIKKFVPFPRLTPLQPDVYGHPRKRASLSAPPHPSGLPTGRRKASKQNSCPWQYKMSLQRRLRTVTLDLRGASPIALFLSYHVWDEGEPLEPLNS